MAVPMHFCSVFVESMLHEYDKLKIISYQAVLEYHQMSIFLIFFGLENLLLSQKTDEKTATTNPNDK